MLLLIHHKQTVHAALAHHLQGLEDRPPPVDGLGPQAHDIGGPDVPRVGPQAVFPDEGTDILIGRMLQDVLRCVALDDMPALDDTDAVGQLDGLIHVVGDKDDGFPCLLLQGVNLVLEL